MDIKEKYKNGFTKESYHGKMGPPQIKAEVRFEDGIGGSLTIKNDGSIVTEAPLKTAEAAACLKGNVLTVGMLKRYLSGGIPDPAVEDESKWTRNLLSAHRYLVSAVQDTRNNTECVDNYTISYITRNNFKLATHLKVELTRSLENVVLTAMPPAIVSYVIVDKSSRVRRAAIAKGRWINLLSVDTEWKPIEKVYTDGYRIIVDIQKAWDVRIVDNKVIVGNKFMSGQQPLRWTAILTELQPGKYPQELETGRFTVINTTHNIAMGFFAISDSGNSAAKLLRDKGFVEISLGREVLYFGYVTVRQKVDKGCECFLVADILTTNGVEA